MLNFRHQILTSTLLLAALLAAPAADVAAQQPKRTTEDFELGKATEILANIMREFEMGYVDKVDAGRMLEYAAEGMVRATDPYSEYLSEEDMEQFEILTTGRYGGVGSLIRKRGDYVLFAQPYKGSPSDLAGIKVGDKILAIDGHNAYKMDVSEVSKRLKGQPETAVEVVIERSYTGAVDTLNITRRHITIPSVSYAGIIRDGIGYISHNDFIEGSYNEVRAALERLMDSDSLRGLILDYRSNGGGLVQEAIDIASLFVPRGERIVSIMGRDSSSLRDFRTEHLPLATELPIVMLVSSSSASASEILAGALQDTDRGVIMGQRTFGKGLVQGTRHVGYNSFLKYTTAKYYIPSGRCIQAVNYASRDEDGSVRSVPDSLISEFSTRGGRKVYDGGGIVPDVKIEPEYVSRFALTLYAMGYMENWADEYMRKHHREPIDIRTFAISDSDYADFTAYIAEQDIHYESNTRHALNALEEAVEEDLYGEELGAALDALRALVKDDKVSNMETYSREIREAMNGYIVMRYAYNEGAVEHNVVHDPTVDQAVELLLNGEEYRRILREQDLSMH